MYGHFIHRLKTKISIVLMNGKLFILMLSKFLLHFCKVDSAHNKAVTDKITKDVINDGSYKEHSDIACK